MGLIEGAFDHLSVRNALLLLVLFLSVRIIITRLDRSRRLSRLPGARAKIIPGSFPLGLPYVFETVRTFRGNANIDHWQRIFRAIGTYTGETSVLGQRVILTADPENIKAVLASQFTDFGKGEPFHRDWKDFLGDSIFTTDGERWHKSRQLIRPQFNKNRVSDLHCFESHLQVFFRALANGGALNSRDQVVGLAATNGKVVNVMDLFFRYTMDVTTEFLLGEDVGSLSSPASKFADAFNQVQQAQLSIAIASRLNFLVSREPLHRGLEILNSTIGHYIERALALSPEELESKTKSDKDYTFLHELASFTRDKKVLRDQILANLLAGRDTTACTLSWTLYELGRHPEVVRKIRAEILRQVGPSRAPDYADLPALRYIRSVIDETLRVYPVVPFNVRLALRDTTLPRGGGPDGSQPLPVLKDTPVRYSTIVMQHRPDLFPAASESFPPLDVFCPDRWEADGGWQPAPWTYLPFNAGPRVCIGQQFALTELTYVLCRLFQRYDRVESYMHDVDGGEPRRQSGIIMQPADGVRVAFWEAATGTEVEEKV